METVEQTIERPQEPQTETRAEMNAEIRQIAETAGLTRAWEDQQVDAEATAEDARRAAFEAAQIAGLIAANPTMSDGKTVFNATSHGNTSASSGSTVADITTDLNAARLAMRRQKGLAGKAINVVPKFVLVPPELETAMKQALSQVQATRTTDTNPFASLSLIVDPRLTDSGQWYLAADPAQIDGLEYAYLEGAPGPQIETRAGFEVDGLLVKVRLDFGAGWIDWRGWYRVG